MRIFYAAGATPNGSLPDSQIWRRNLLDALVSLGHEVVELEFDLEPLIAAANTHDPANAAFVVRERPQASAAILAEVRRAHAERRVDLFFSYLYSSCATPTAIEAIRELGIPTVNWYCNGSYQLDLVAEIAPAFDHCLVPEAFRLDDYRRLGAKPIYCQEAANPDLYDIGDVPQDIDVLFVGARYADRPDYIRRLVDEGVDVHVFGPGWRPAPRSAWRAAPRRARKFLAPGGARTAVQRLRTSAGARRHGVALPAEICHGPVTDDELPRTYARGKIVLGFSTVGQTHLASERMTQVRLRDFEVPMTGSFYLVEHLEELSTFYDFGREIETYRDADELVEKCRHYLAHPDARDQVRRAGRARALRDHTWQARLTEAFRQMGVE